MMTGRLRALTAAAAFAVAAHIHAAVYDMKSFGAKGDGSTLDSPAINRAIDAAAAGNTA